MDDNMCLSIPNSEIYLKPGYKIRLGRFESDIWIVSYGWYTWGGNRPVCGWYLIRSEISSHNEFSAEQSPCIKPLQLTDLYDIYVIEN